MTTPGRNGHHESLGIYLRNHEAAAQGGCELFGRAATSWSESPQGDLLRRLHTDVRTDLTHLHAVMASLGVRPEPLAGAVVRLGERLGRLKPNGRLVHRSPLSDLIEVEALVDVVTAKGRGWRALRAAAVSTPAGTPTLDELIERAEEQLDHLTELHLETAARVLPQH